MSLSQFVPTKFLSIFILGVVTTTTFAAENTIKHRNSFSYSQLDQKSHVNVATWNIRQASKAKFERTVETNGDTKTIAEFISDWFQKRTLDILAIQEFQDKTDLRTDVTESPLDVLEPLLPKEIKVLKGQPIREPTKRGQASLWQDYCPIFYNTKKLNCTSPEDARIQIGIDYALGPNSELISTIQTPRYVNWAYCESTDKKFDFVISCVHVNFKTADTHIRAIPDVITQILDEEVETPQRFRGDNLDFLFLGDFNLDRRSGVVFEEWGNENFVIDPILPEFPNGTRWKKSSFTKLKDIYTFTEARKRSTDIYDDVTHTTQMSESLVSKYVDPLIDDFFVNSSNNRVDMRALLSVSDHLPVIATFDLNSDTD